MISIDIRPSKVEKKDDLISTCDASNMATSILFSEKFVFYLEYAQLRRARRRKARETFSRIRKPTVEKSAP